jgi:hypothetical protein
LAKLLLLLLLFKCIAHRTACFRSSWCPSAGSCCGYTWFCITECAPRSNRCRFSQRLGLKCRGTSIRPGATNPGSRSPWWPESRAHVEDFLRWANGIFCRLAHGQTCDSCRLTARVTYMALAPSIHGYY